MTGPADGVDSIRDLERQRRLAMLAGDSETLSDLCSMGLVYTHSMGDQDSRSSYLEKVANGHFVYRELSFDIDSIDVSVDTALVHGRISGKVDVSGEPRHLKCSYLAVWSAEGNVWKFRAFQPTPIL